MAATKKITMLVLAASLSVTVLAQGNKPNGGPPPGQRRGPGFSQSNPGKPGNRHFGDWLRQSQNLTPQQKQQALENDPKFKSLSPDMQQRLRSRLEWFNSLPPDRQQKILARMEMWEHMPPEQKQRGKQLADRLRSLPDERRGAVRQQCRSLGGMNMDQRQRTMGSDQFRRSFNDDERDIIGKCLEFHDNNSESAIPSLDDDK